MDRKGSSVVNAVRLAERMSKILDRQFIAARIVDRGAYATVYQLIEESSSSKSARPDLVVRVSTRPVYHDVAIDEERQKIKTYVATLNVIHGKSVLMILIHILTRLGSIGAETSAKASAQGTGIRCVRGCRIRARVDCNDADGWVESGRVLARIRPGAAKAGHRRAREVYAQVGTVSRIGRNWIDCDSSWLEPSLHLQRCAYGDLTLVAKAERCKQPTTGIIS